MSRYAQGKGRAHPAAPSPDLPPAATRACDAPKSACGLEDDRNWADALRSGTPELSAGSPMWLWQRIAITVLAAAGALGLWMDARGTAVALMAMLIPLFLCVVLIRLAGLVHVLGSEPVQSGTSDPDAASRDGRGTTPELPSYSVLVPLFQEDAVIPNILGAMAGLEWPRDRIDILFITEEQDDATRARLLQAMAGLPAADRAIMSVITVPRGSPQTKPRALTYALRCARGDLVVVYDAEDEPEPDQLLRAYERLSAPGQRTGCVQARLNIYNPRASFLSRQFTLEYTALFDAILPALQWLRLPVPLGGTSNHFWRTVLDQVGGWDPYNVTEDADLGLRLARAGWTIAIIPSTTWEEAPATFSVWFGQRTRWLKGWMQTLLVHTRRPPVLWRDLGGRAFAGFFVLMGGYILSALVHPIVYAMALAAYAGGMEVSPLPGDGTLALAWWAGAANLILAYLAGGWLAVAAVRRRHGPVLGRQLAWHALFIPIYWILISAAAYRALVDLAIAPFHWRKTAHMGRTGGGRPASEHNL